MNISLELTGNILEYLEEKVASGSYKSRGDVIKEAVREMIQRDLMKQLKEKGLNSLEEFEKARNEISGELLEKTFNKKI